MKLLILVPGDDIWLDVKDLIELNSGSAAYVPTPTDVNPSNISFRKLQELLSSARKFDYSSSTDALGYLQPGSDYLVPITSNDTLADALRDCQVPMEDCIDVYCVPKDEVGSISVLSAGTGESSVLPRAQNTERRRRR